MTPRTPRWVPLAAGFCLLAAPAIARSFAVHPSTQMAGPLATLIAPQAGKSYSESSWERNGGNADFRPLEPGQTLTLMDVSGPGVVQRFWCTIAPRAHKEIHRQAILRMYWDNETTPSVEAPIGDFFGIGFGEQVDFQSAPLNQTSGGYNCYWPMPFHKRARWTLTNMSNRRIDAFYYNVQYMKYDSLAKDTRLFHAQWRRENPTTPGKMYTILEAKGAGHYVGTAMFMQPRKGRSMWYLEGDEMFWVDGEKQPSTYGTGTEDYFSSGWYYDRGPYSALYHGVPIKDESQGRISTYRWHIPDPIPFKKSIRIAIEHGGASETRSDYSSVAYWYQTEPHVPFDTLPKDPKDLLPTILPPPVTFPGAIEAEKQIRSAKASEGGLEAQETNAWDGDWSGEHHLWWRATKVGATLTLNLPAAAAGEYEVVAYFTKAPDYGIVQVQKDGKDLGPKVNLWAPGVEPAGPVSLGRTQLKAGDNPITVVVTGKDIRSDGTYVGIDAFVLKPAS